MKDEITTLLKSNPKISETLCEIGIMQVEQIATLCAFGKIIPAIADTFCPRANNRIKAA
jgi:hypothetical protein